MDVEIKHTLNGKGIVALRDFSEEEILFEVTGPFVTCDEDEDMDERMRSNTFRYSEELYISPAGNVGDFQNHSCEPNAKVVKTGDRLFVVAAQPIRKGEEILIDYSTIVAADDVWEMQCACGSDSCRGVIKSFNTLPAELRQKYEQSGMVPQYILEI